MNKISLILFLLFLSISGGIIAQPIVDYRAWQSPVKNQENRGTCTAFSIVAAMETLPGMPFDLSEQYIYAQIKMNHYKEMPLYEEGTFLKFYANRLTVDGTLREDQEPYNPNAVIWDSTESSFDKMREDIGGTSLLDMLSMKSFAYKIQPNMYTYRAGAEARDVEWIKERLDQGIKCIPVCYNVNGSYWFSHSGNESEQIDPNDFLIFFDALEEYTVEEAIQKYRTNDLYSLILDGTLDARYSDMSFEIDNAHAVAIVGYDANGFLIKNSWGTEIWGDKGYGWVSFDYHRLYATEILTLPRGKVAVNEWAEPLVEERKKEAFKLKSLPVENYNAISGATERGISLSVVFYGEGKMPRFTEIEYKGYDAAGKLIGTWYGGTHGIFDGRETGYESYVFLKDRAVFPYIAKIVASMTTNSGWNFQNTYYNLEAKNKEYKAQ